MSQTFFIAAIILLGVFFIIWILISFFKKSQNSDNNTTKQKCARCSVMFHVIFGFISSSIFIFTPYLFYESKNRYSDFFLPEKYEYSIKDKITVDNIEREYTIPIETYHYVDYPLLKEIYDIYYEKSDFGNHKIIKLDMNFESLGMIYTYLAIVACPILIIVSFILICCTQCNDKKCQLGFAIIEIISIILKLFIIFWPYYWNKTKYKGNINTDDEDIKYLIDDYINYSKCRKEFPIIIIIECFYILLEITVIIVTFCQSKYEIINDSSNAQVIPINNYETQSNTNNRYQPQTTYNPNLTNPNPPIIVIERERIVNREVPVMVQQKR